MAGTSTASTSDPKTTLQMDHSKKDWKIVNDAIFGIIELKPYIVKIIDTVEFQRLRWIWQLGVAPFVYPTADHSRFEHSIGTYHLASKLVRKLQKQVGKEVITDDDVKCVEIAALCHDIGHGPFSHIWDNTVLPNIFPNQEKMKHEDHFLHVWIKKFKDIINDDRVDGKLIAALINGKATEGKEILSTIVSNSESGMDVDKWDYLARDASYLGHSSTNYRIDIDRMIHLARAIKDEDGKWKIAFRKSEGLNMLRVFQLRHYMHKTAYQHKTVKAIELMMLDGLKRYFEKTENESLKHKIGTSEWILENDDSFVLNIMKSEDYSVFKRILERDLYKLRLEAVIYVRVEKDPRGGIIRSLKLNIFHKDEIECEMGHSDKSTIIGEIIKKFKESNEREISNAIDISIIDKFQELFEIVKSIIEDFEKSDNDTIVKYIINRFKETNKGKTNEEIIRSINEKLEKRNAIVKYIIKNFTKLDKCKTNETLFKYFIEKFKESNEIVKYIENKFKKFNEIVNSITEKFHESNESQISDESAPSIMDSFIKLDKFAQIIIEKLGELDNGTIDETFVKSFVEKGNESDEGKINDEIVAYIMDRFKELDEIVKNNFRFSFMTFKLDSTKGGEYSNSLCSIPFYEKGAPDTIFRYTDDNIPSYLRYNVDESRFMIFTVQNKGEGVADGAVSKVLKDLKVIFDAKGWNIELYKHV